MATAPTHPNLEGRRVVAPQPGAQKRFLQSQADVAIFGGGAGSGKTFSLLLEPLYYASKFDNFGAVIFRRTQPQITNQGGLWDSSWELYPHTGARPVTHRLTWRWLNGSRVSMKSLQYEQTCKDVWHGSQIPLICFDELTTFTRYQFFYMLSRNRSMTGAPGRFRATTNADGDSWVAKFIAWWIDQDTGFAIPERAGALRWFGRDGDELVWGNTREEVESRLGPSTALSVAFVPGKLSDNPAMARKDPGYLSKLRALSYVDRQRLEHANWKIRVEAGSVFRKSWFRMVPEPPADLVLVVRYWDRAASRETEENPNPDWTAGVLMGKTGAGKYVVLHVERFRGDPGEVVRRIKATAERDRDQYRNYQLWLEKDPAAAGKTEAFYLAGQLAEYHPMFFPVSSDKVTKSGPFAHQASALNVDVVDASWTDEFLNECGAFPEGANDDQVDAAAGAFLVLSRMPTASSAGKGPSPSRGSIPLSTVPSRSRRDLVDG